jgi:hypothetical protein
MLRCDACAISGANLHSIPALPWHSACAALMDMRVLQWRPRSPVHRSTLETGPIPFKFPAIGEFAGRARYVPGDLENLPALLRAAAGSVVDLEFAGIANPGARFVGQSLYRECSGQRRLGDLVIPEQDLDFIP